MRRKYNLLTILIALTLTPHCGKIKMGSVAAINESAPTGSIVAQGAFTALNNKAVSGNVEIYLTRSGTYTIRLASLSSPSEAGLQVIGKADGEEIYRSTLKYASGSQNYATQIPQNNVTQWNSVSIRSITNITTPEYGQALLLTVTPSRYDTQQAL